MRQVKRRPRCSFETLAYPLVRWPAITWAYVPRLTDAVGGSPNLAARVLGRTIRRDRQAHSAGSRRVVLIVGVIGDVRETGW